MFVLNLIHNSQPQSFLKTKKPAFEDRFLNLERMILAFCSRFFSGFNFSFNIVGC